MASNHVRRLAVAVVGALAAATMAGCAGGAAGDEPVKATGPYNAKRFQGTKLRFLAAQTGWSNLLTDERLKGFESATGIDVEMEKLPEAQMRQRLQVSLTSNSSDYDVYMTSVLQDGARFANAGWYQDLKPYVNNSSLTDPAYNFGGFSKAIVDGHTIDGQLSALPVQMETQLFYYRKDLLEKAGLEVPKTFDELEAAAKKLNDPQAGVSGWATRGKGAAAVTQFANFLYGYGSDYVKDGKAAFDTEAGRQAFKEYGSLLRDYGPKGAVDQSWEELLPLFQQGKLAMWADNSGQVAEAINPQTSKVAHKVGFAKMPTGPAQQTQSWFGWGVAISALSKNKEAAWQLVQWLTGPESGKYVQSKGVASGRSDVPFGDSVPKDFVKAYQESLDTARPQLPRLDGVPEARDAIGAAIVTSIQGGDVDAAVTKAAQAVTDIAQRSNK